MNAEEVLDLKTKTETAIRLALNEFSAETGFHIDRIELTHHYEYRDESRHEPFPVQRVLLSVRLP